MSGYIRDASKGESLVSANIWENNSKSGANTSTYGFYRLTG
ncbi:MAG: hypothetical protein ACLFUB_10470 [Cyclobacteriaceae bacterium]